MPQLRKIFRGFYPERADNDPLQRKYAICFQSFIRSYNKGLIDNLNKTTRQDRRDKVAAELASDLFQIPGATERDWRVVCSVIQWLGSTAGQIYLRSLK